MASEPASLTGERGGGAERVRAPHELGAPPADVYRFAATERAVHAVHGASFLLMLATGLMLFLPQLAGLIGNRPLIKGAHLVIAVLWLTGLLLVAVLGDRRVLRRSWRQFESLDRTDLRWLRSQAARGAAQGRFNGGQKLHGIVQPALTILFFVSGTFLWLGERNHALRLPGALALHDVAMIIGALFVAGHIWIAVSPGARASLPGMLTGRIPLTYARSHHADWDPATEPTEHLPLLTPARLALAIAITAAGALGALLLA